MAIQISGTTVIDNSRNVNAGVVTATSFFGSGSGLTGVGPSSQDVTSVAGITNQRLFSNLAMTMLC